MSRDAHYSADFWLDDDDLDDTRDPCRLCGCTERVACPGGCHWVEYDLCSACAEAMRDHPMLILADGYGQGAEREVVTGPILWDDDDECWPGACRVCGEPSLDDGDGHVGWRLDLCTACAGRLAAWPLMRLADGYAAGARHQFSCGPILA